MIAVLFAFVPNIVFAERVAPCAAVQYVYEDSGERVMPFISARYDLVSRTLTVTPPPATRIHCSGYEDYDPELGVLDPFWAAGAGSGQGGVPVP